MPKGTAVTDFAPIDEPVHLASPLGHELDAALDEADREVGGQGPDFLESLKRYG